MTFTVPWRKTLTDSRRSVREPILEIFMRATDGRSLREVFVVDSGADLSMGPRKLCDLLGFDWESGTPIKVRGIAPLEECTVVGMIHQVEIAIRKAACRLLIPFCFAEGDAPSLLGREGFFDAFRIQLDKQKHKTRFELITH